MTKFFKEYYNPNRTKTGFNKYVSYSTNLENMLDEALKYFHDAGCAQTDIENAIKMHKGKRMEAAK